VGEIGRQCRLAMHGDCVRWLCRRRLAAERNAKRKDEAEQHASHEKSPEAQALLIRGVTYHGLMATHCLATHVLLARKSRRGLDSPPLTVYTRGKVILLPQLGNR
jgi:hypothetical protein